MFTKLRSMLRWGLALVIVALTTSAPRADELDKLLSPLTYLQTPQDVEIGAQKGFFDSLPDRELANLASQAFASNRSFPQLTRHDMVKLFASVAQRPKVTQEAIDTLRAIANNPRLHLPDHVRYLTGKVVDGDPSNNFCNVQETETVAGKVTYSVIAVKLGNLKVGSSGKHLSRLVDKWFFGKDLPGLPLNEQALPIHGARYIEARGSLFGRGIGYRDIAQGATGDCYFLAPLAVLAAQSPDVIKAMFIDNGDGTYTIRFFDYAGTPAYVTVNRELPVDEKGRFLFANSGQSSTDETKLWVPLLEKAFAQLNHSGWVRFGEKHSYGNRYKDIGWGSARLIFPILTGLPLENNRVHLASNGPTKAEMIKAIQKRQPVTLSSRRGEEGAQNTYQAGKFSLVYNHAYAVVGYDPASETFTVYNPWGRDPLHADANLHSGATVELHLSWEQLAEMFVGCEVGSVQ